MISFFQNRKPKQFNYKPRYTSSEPKDENKIDFTKKKYVDAMYERYDRQKFSEIKEQGKRSIMIKSVVLAVLLIALIIYFDKIEALLREI